MLYPQTGMNVVIASLLLAAPIGQTSVELKLKLREDETVKFRNVLNVVTFSPDKIDERVANTLTAFTFGAEVDGKIPVKAVVEEFEDMDPASADASAAIKTINLAFSLTKKGVTEPVKHSVSNSALEPAAALIRRTLDGMNSTGFLGLAMPERAVSVGEKWTVKVDAKEFLALALAPVESAFKVTGSYVVTFELVDVINVNNKRHARIEAKTSGDSEIEINAPEFNAGGTLKVNGASSILVDLSTGLITRSKTDISGDLDLGVANAQLVVSSLTYRV